MSDERMDRIIGNLLRAGVMLSAAVVLAGGTWYLAVSGGGPADYRHFHPQPGHWLAPGAPAAPQSVIELGLLLLIATPIARVAFTLAAFALARDRVYAAITLAVLLVLLYSLGTSWL